MKFFGRRLGVLVTELVLNGLFVIGYFLLRNEWIAAGGTLAELTESGLNIYKYIAPFVVAFATFHFYWHHRCFGKFLRYHVFSLLILIPMFISIGDLQFTAILATAHLVSSFMSLKAESKSDGNDLIDQGDGAALDWLVRLKVKPGQVVPASFFLVILIGTLFLGTPFAWEKDQSISFLDALFTATSATCVTGLSVVSLVDQFNIFGQLVTLLLIQIGGLGLMTLSSSMVIILGRRFGLKGKIFMQDVLDTANFEGILKLISDIIKYTFVIELIGAIILTLSFTYEGMEFTQALYAGVFHSISAFCNAGFSLFNDSMIGYRDNYIINWTIMALIILGGLGFIVLKELRFKIAENRSLKGLSLHSKIVLSSNAILFGGGAVYIYFSEFLNSLNDLSFLSQVHVSLFQSVVTRTAGFNSVALNDLQMSTVFVMMILMLIGASPGSTGGGIKTTTVAILFRSIITILNGESDVDFFGRRIPSQLVIKAIALVIVSLITVGVALLTLIHLEPNQSFIELAFEAVSAFATVGLSLGITPELGVGGKILITILMFIGRVGPLSLVLAVGERAGSSSRREYPEGRVLIG